MKFWMSGEVMGDVDSTFHRATKLVEPTINDLLTACQLQTKFEKWAFIAIILPPGVLDYKEIAKKHMKRKALEFRLRIDHVEFLNATDRARTRLIIDALHRSVGLMPKLGVSRLDCNALEAVIASAGRKLAFDA